MFDSRWAGITFKKCKSQTWHHCHVWLFGSSNPSHSPLPRWDPASLLEPRGPMIWFCFYLTCWTSRAGVLPRHSVIPHSLLDSGLQMLSDVPSSFPPAFLKNTGWLYVLSWQEDLCDLAASSRQCVRGCWWKKPLKLPVLHTQHQLINVWML